MGNLGLMLNPGVGDPGPERVAFCVSPLPSGDQMTIQLKQLCIDTVIIEKSHMTQKLSE